MSSPAVDAGSSDPNIAAVKGTQTGEDGTGVLGIGQGNGVLGQSKGSKGFSGVRGESDGGPGVSGASVGSVGVDAKTQTGPAAVRAVSAGNGPGVFGTGLHVGVFGTSTGNEGFAGVHGESNGGPGVSGTSTGSVGVDAKTQSGPAAMRAIHAGDGVGVLGACHGNGFSGVWGDSKTGPGVSGTSTSSDGVFGKGHRGVRGESEEFQGVSGWSNNNAGVVGESVHLSGVWAISHDPQNAGLFATNDKGGPAAFFQGNVVVTGDVSLPNADCAEEFEMAEATMVDPGTVMVLDAGGALAASARAYDKCVVGVISGAGAYRPAIVLDRQPNPLGNRRPLALVGKVFCKVDADFSAIAVGDLLTTSSTPGHAMAALDSAKAFGAVIGKALQPLREGRGLIPILVALQ
jgi:hypothetical protein